MPPGLETPKTAAEIVFLAATAIGCAIGLVLAIRRIRRDRRIRLWIRGASADDLAALLEDPSRSPPGLAGPILIAEAMEALWKQGDRRVLNAAARGLEHPAAFIRHMTEDAIFALSATYFFEGIRLQPANSPLDSLLFSIRLCWHRMLRKPDPKACRAWLAAHDVEIVFDETEKSFVRKAAEDGKA